MEFGNTLKFLSLRAESGDVRGHVVRSNRSNWTAVIVRYFYRLFFFPSFTLAHDPQPVVPPTVVSARLLPLSLSVPSVTFYFYSACNGGSILNS